MDDDAGAGGHRHHAETPGQTIGEEQIVGMLESRFGQQNPAIVHVLPDKLVSQTVAA